MAPLHIEVTDIKYRRPGLSKVEFFATYEGFTRRGTVVYDTVNKQFVTHTKDVELLAAVCVSLQRPRYQKIG
jgi:hypothetical protein